MTYISNMILCASIMQVFFNFFFAISFVRRFFANTGISEKKTKNPREESIFDDPFEESITEDSKRTLSLRIIKRTSSLRNLKKN